MFFRKWIIQITALALFLISLNLIAYFHQIVPGLAQSQNSLVYALPSEVKTLDPAQASDSATAKVLINIYDGLVGFKPGTSEIEPRLAVSWQVSRQGQQWTFHLRKGVTFQDGTAFNADAVKYNVERQLQPRVQQMPYSTFVYGLVQKIETPDPYTVRFDLKYPYTSFINNLAMPWAAPIASPSAIKKYGQDYSRHPVGTGPYRLVDWQSGRLILEANKNYWGTSPKISQVIFQTYPDRQSCVQALLTGKVQIVDDLTPSEAKTLSAANQTVISVPGASLDYLGLYTNKKPFQDDHLRRIISASINREAIARKLFNDPKTEANSLIPPSLPGFNQNIHPYYYEPKTAASMLKQLGYNGLSITLLTYDDTRPYNPAGGKALAEMVKADLENVGFRVQIKSYPWAQYKTALQKQEGDLFLYGWVSDNADEDDFFNLLTSAQIEKGLNLAHFNNKEVDEILTQARQTTDKNERESLYYHAEQIVLQEAPWVLLNYSLNIAASSPNVTGLSLEPTGGIRLERVNMTRKTS